MLRLKALNLLVLAVTFKTLGATHIHDPALHFRRHHSPGMPMACYLSMSAERPDLLYRAYLA